VCFAIPSRVIETDGLRATVECFGVRRLVELALMAEPVAVGDYLLVRSGRYAMQRIEPEHAGEVLDCLQSLTGVGDAAA
jgi:hydrogenase expression/formation protein HypC